MDSLSGASRDSTQGLVVIVADTSEERLALAADIPAGSPVLIAATVSQAKRVLAQLPAAGHAWRAEAQEPSRRTRPGLVTASERVGIASAPGQLATSDHAPRLREDRLSLVMGEREVQLTQLEFALMKYLLPRLGEVATFEQLSQVGWHAPYLGSGAHMHAAVSRLRTKIAGLGAPLVLEAVRGLGFRLVRHPKPMGRQEVVGH